MWCPTLWRERRMLDKSAAALISSVCRWLASCVVYHGAKTLAARGIKHWVKLFTAEWLVNPDGLQHLLHFMILSNSFMFSCLHFWEIILILFKKNSGAKKIFYFHVCCVSSCYINSLWMKIMTHMFHSVSHETFGISAVIWMPILSVSLIHKMNAPNSTSCIISLASNY